MTSDQIVPALLHACPTAAGTWKEHLDFWNGGERGDYNDVAVFAHHIVDSQVSGKIDEFVAFFSVIEEMIESGDERVKDLAVTGLIEDIQNIASHQPNVYSAFEPWLGPRSREAWVRVEAAWTGVSSLADMIRRERGGV